MSLVYDAYNMRIPSWLVNTRDDEVFLVGSSAVLWFLLKTMTRRQ